MDLNVTTKTVMIYFQPRDTCSLMIYRYHWSAIATVVTCLYKSFEFVAIFYYFDLDNLLSLQMSYQSHSALSMIP